MKKIIFLVVFVILMFVVCEKDIVNIVGNNFNGELVNLMIGIVRDYLLLDLVR